MDRIEISGIRKIFDLVQKMPDAIDLSLGQPDFETPPEVRRAAQKSIEEGHNRYTVTQGLPELRERLLARAEERSGGREAGVIVTGGSAGALFEAFMVLVEEGDEVVIPDPYFVLYCHLVRVCGGTPVLLDTYPDFRIRASALEACVTPRTKLVIVNSPCNPTGVALRADELQAVAAVARKHGLLLISDEIYDSYAYDGPHESLYRHYENTLLVGGFSKTYSVTGWRLGYAAGPPDIVERMTMFQQFSFVCANAPAQRAALAMLDLDMTPYVEAYRRKRDLAYAGLQDVYRCVRPEGAFYLFPECPGGDDRKFIQRAIEAGVLIVPGSACSARRTHFRLSFAVSEEKLKRGIDLLRRLARADS